MLKQPWIPGIHCDFCGRRMLPNRPGASDQSLLVTRGERKVLACMSWQGLKAGKVPCGFAWRRMDEMLRNYVPEEAVPSGD